MSLLAVGLDAAILGMVVGNAARLVLLAYLFSQGWMESQEKAPPSSLRYLHPRVDGSPRGGTPRSDMARAAAS